MKSTVSNTIHSSVLIDELLDSGATYSSITLLDQKGNACFSKCSSEEWLHTYINSGLYLKCHLMQEANNQIKNHKKGFIFIWDKYFPNNDESIYLNNLRKEKNISHGVAFCSPLENGGKAIITITGKHYDINFSKHVIRNKQTIYRAIMRSLVSQ
ncbi:MAG: hypothetical protein WC785_04740 [Tatlockia sp.]